MKQIYIKLRAVLAVVLLCIAPNILLAQSKIGGTVIDDNKQPLPGVSVTLKGTKKVLLQMLTVSFCLQPKRVRL